VAIIILLYVLLALKNVYKMHKWGKPSQGSLSHVAFIEKPFFAEASKAVLRLPQESKKTTEANQIH
jgi:hypothetical protein